MSEAYMPGGGAKTLTQMSTTVTPTNTGYPSYRSQVLITLPTGYTDKDIETFCAVMYYREYSMVVTKSGGKWWYIYEGYPSTGRDNGIRDITSNVSQSGQTLTIGYDTTGNGAPSTCTYVGYWNR